MLARARCSPVRLLNCLRIAGRYASTVFGASSLTGCKEGGQVGTQTGSVQGQQAADWALRLTCFVRGLAQHSTYPQWIIHDACTAEYFVRPIGELSTEGATANTQEAGHTPAFPVVFCAVLSICAAHCDRLPSGEAQLCFNPAG